MRVRPLLIGALTAAVLGALATLLVGVELLPPVVNRLAMPGVVLLWGTAVGWGMVVALNAVVYAGVGAGIGVLIAVHGGRATRAPAT